MKILWQKLLFLIKQNRAFLFGSFLVFGFAFCYNLCFFNRYFPLSEGWYCALGNLLNQGNVLYKDIPWIFPPVFPYLMAFLLKIVGGSFFWLRLIGVCWFCLIFWLLFLLLTKFFKIRVAVLATISTVPLFLTQIVFIGYDYYPFYLLMALIGCWFLVKAIQSKQLIKRYKIFAVYSFIAGIFATLAILTRQNSGFFTMVMPFIGLCFIGFSNFSLKTLFKATVPYVLGILLTCILIGSWLYFNDAFLPFINQTIFQAAQPKGGLATSLFAWIFKLSLKKAVRYALVVLLIITVIPWMTIRGFDLLNKDSVYRIFRYKLNLFIKTYIPFCYKLIHILQKNLYKHFYLFLFIGGLIFTLGGFFTHIHWMKPIFKISGLVFLATFLTIAGIIVFVTAMYSQKFNKKFFSNFQGDFSVIIIIFMFSMGLIWGGGTSFAAAVENSFISIAILLAFIFQKIYSSKKFFMLAIFLIFFLPTAFNAREKSKQVYNWWGMTSFSLAKNNNKINLPYLKGIFTFSNNKNALEQVTKIILDNTTESDKIFTYPQIPIFYFLTNRKPATKAIVHWFDVCPIPWVEEDIKILQENPPKIIVFDDMSKSIYLGHENLFNHGQNSAQRKMLKLLKNLAFSKYDHMGKYKLDSDHTIEIYKLKTEG